MPQLIYALRFQGETSCHGFDGAVLTIAAGAPGCTIGTRIGPEGVSGSLDRAIGDDALLESEWVFTSATTFQEEGTVAFGQGGHRLRFSTFGSAYLGPVAEDGRRRGVAIRWVEGGDGQFEGARGLIASALVVDEAGDVTDHQLGMVDID